MPTESGKRATNLGKATTESGNDNQTRKRRKLIQQKQINIQSFMTTYFRTRQCCFTVQYFLA